MVRQEIEKQGCGRSSMVEFSKAKSVMEKGQS